MIIYGSRAQDKIKSIEEKKQKYIDKYNKKKAEYDEQHGRWQSASEEFRLKIIEKLNGILGFDISAIKGINIYISGSSLVIQYKHEFPEDDRYYKKLSWSYHAGISWDSHLYHHPEFEGKLSEGSSTSSHVDLSILKESYDILSKLEMIDWQDICNQIKDENPKWQDYITVENPGQLDTSEYDRELRRAGILRYVGKDVWIKVQYKAKSNGYTENYYIKINSVNDAGTYCSVLCVPSYVNVPIQYTWTWRNRYELERKVERKELRTAGIEICEPMEIYSQAEFIAPMPTTRPDGTPV